MSVIADKRVGESKLENLTNVVACKSRKFESEKLTPISTVSYCARLSDSASRPIVAVSSGSGTDVSVSSAGGTSAGLPTICFGNISGDGVTINVNINNND